jgi:hypothetical protein
MEYLISMILSWIWAEEELAHEIITSSFSTTVSYSFWMSSFLLRTRLSNW